MSDSEFYDAVVIGTGQGGYPLVKDLARAGWKTAIIEKGDVGGTCVNEGCTPTKTMVASARIAHLAHRAGDYGVKTGQVSVDLKKVRQRKRDIVSDFSIGSRKILENLDGLDLIFGTGSFIARDKIQVDLHNGETQKLQANKIFINVGTRSFVPPIEGIDTIPTLDNKSIMELEETPEHLLVLGGGYIGLEFGQMFRRFGSQVTIIQRGLQLTREDADVAEEIKSILEEDGIEVLINSSAKRVSQNDQGQIELVVQQSGCEQILTGSHLLVAVGRTPNTDLLNLDAAGLSTDRRGYISVNDQLETNVPNIYVIGDAKGGPAFTHISYDDYRVLRTNLLEGGHASIKNRLVPYTMFIDPQLGRIGLSEQQAIDKKHDFRVAKLPMTNVARAIELDETLGFMKVIVDNNTNLILGAAILGIEGGEVMSVLQMAMMGNITYSTIRDSIFAHPTLAESLNNLFMMLDG